MPSVKEPVKKIDIYNEQFNYFFVNKLNSITPEQKNLIPKDLLFKIFRTGNEGSAEKLSFNEKMWILSVAFKHNITIMVDDAKNGIGMRDFGKASQANKGKIKNNELLEDMRINSSFVIADKELMAASLYMNHVSTSSIYSLIKEIIPNVNHKKNQQFTKAKKEINIILSFLINYESNKKRLAMDYGITVPKWYALIYFAIGEKLGHDFYDKDFKYAYSANRWTLNRDMNELHDSGYLLRRGVKKQYKYSLTAAGVNLLNRIFDNILFKL